MTACCALREVAAFLSSVVVETSSVDIVVAGVVGNTGEQLNMKCCGSKYWRPHLPHSNGISVFENSGSGLVSSGVTIDACN